MSERYRLELPLASGDIGCVWVARHWQSAWSARRARRGEVLLATSPIDHARLFVARWAAREIVKILDFGNAKSLSPNAALSDSAATAPMTSVETTFVLHTPRLELRQLTLADADFILELLNEPSFIQNIGDKGVRNRADAERYLLEGPIESYRTNDHGLYRVTLKDSAVPLGLSGLVKRAALPGPDLGYAFLPRFWSQGFASEAARAVLAYETQKRPLNKVFAIVSPGNGDSIKLLVKLGFVHTGYQQMQSEADQVAVYEWSAPPGLTP